MIDTLRLEIPILPGNKDVLDQLKVINKEVLCDSLTMENVSEILILANLHCTDQLKVSWHWS